MSLPSRGRGLKYTILYNYIAYKIVAPFTGAWIEISPSTLSNSVHEVAPFTGAWIEIVDTVRVDNWSRSLPSRGRGLKCSYVT